MDILQFALTIEIEIGDVYRQAAAQAPHRSLRNVLQMLAVAEETHAQAIADMRRQILPGGCETSVLADGEDLLASIRASLEGIGFMVDELQLYERARDIEYEKEFYYRRKTQQTNDFTHRKLFEALAREEHKHFLLMDNLCDRIKRALTADLDTYPKINGAGLNG